MNVRQTNSGSAIAAAAICLYLGAGASLPAFADHEMSEASAIARMANLITPERATELAVAAKPGAVTDFDLDHERNGWVYELEIVDAQGTEWEVQLEAVTGKVLRVRRDWF